MNEAGKPMNFNHVIGFKREDWRDGESRISIEAQPLHLNGMGLVHGGVLVTLLDVANGMSGLFCTVKGNGRHAVTVSLTTNFIGQARVGKLIATGRRTASGRTIFFAEGEVRSESGELLATASSVHRFRSGSEKPEGVPNKA